MIRWPAAPDPLPPLDGNVHVWAVHLDDSSFDKDPSLRRLSSEEQERAARFKFSRDRRRYILAHVALRDILSAYLNITGEAVRFDVGESGKPKLARAFAEYALEFNLTHSNERALIALGKSRVVGVDIEFVHRDFPFHEVATHFFTAREVSALNGLPETLQRTAFYKCWTSKEAFLKAKGVGLSGALDEVEIACKDADHVIIGAAVSGWSLKELELGDGYEGALVVEGRAAPILCYGWRGIS